MHRIIRKVSSTTGLNKTVSIKIAKHRYISACVFGEDVMNKIKNKTDNVITKTSTIGSDLIYASSDTGLENAIKMMQTLENKIRNDKLKDINITVSISLGPIGISMSKNIVDE